jgi:hypothetical protein
MRRSGRRTVGAVALLVAGIAGPSGAQVRGFGQVGGGLGIPVGEYKDSGAKTGWAAQLAAGIAYGMTGGRISGTFVRNGFQDTDEHFRLLGAMADFIVSPSTSGQIAPYFLGGIGFQNAKSSFAGTEAATKFAWNVGAGLGVKVGGIGVFLEGRFLSVRTEGSPLNMIPITVGVLLGQ